MALDPTRYAWIIPPTTQFLDYDGKPLVGGHCILYVHGTTGTPYTSYQNWNPGTPNPEQIPIDNIGHAPAIGANSNSYDLYVYNKFGSLVYSRLNLNTQSGGDTDINTDSTIHGNGSVSDPIGVNIPVVIDGLVRNVVGETDNVHTRVLQYLSDGSIIVGVSVDQNEYEAGFGIKIEDNVISLDPDANLNIDYLTAGSSTAIDGTNLNLNAFVKRVRGDRVFLDSGTIKLKPGTYAVNAFIRINNAGYDLDPNIYNFSVYGGMVLDVPCRTIEYDNSFYHEEKYEISFLTINTNEETAIPLALTTNVKTLLANSNVYLDYIQVYNLNGIIGEGGGGGGGSSTDVEITSNDNSVTINQSTVEDTKVFDLSVRSVPASTSTDEGKVLSVDCEGNPEWVEPEAATQQQADWAQTDSSAVNYIKNKPNIPTDTSDLNNDSGFITASDVPAAQEQADWNESDSDDPAYIKNKPSIPAAQVNSDWNASSGVAEILNKPTIRNVPNVGSTDDGKILKATYSGGVGSYSWDTAPSGSSNLVILDYNDIASTYATVSDMVTDIASGKEVIIRRVSSGFTQFYKLAYINSGTPYFIRIEDSSTDLRHLDYGWGYVTSNMSFSWNNYNNGIYPRDWISTGGQTLSPYIPAGTHTAGEYIFVRSQTYTPYIYKCISDYTQSGGSTRPDQDTTHWARAYLIDILNDISRLKKLSVTPDAYGNLDLVDFYEGKLLISTDDIISLTNSGNVDSVVIQWTAANSTIIPIMPNGYYEASADPAILTVGKTYQLSILNNCYAVVEFA